MTSVPHTVGRGVNERIEWRNEMGQSHREDNLPAREWPSGSKEWWVNGKRHREDGLACEWEWRTSAHLGWWLNGEPLNTDELCDHLKSEINTMMFRMWMLLYQVHTWDKPLHDRFCELMQTLMHNGVVPRYGEPMMGDCIKFIDAEHAKRQQR